VSSGAGWRTGLHALRAEGVRSVLERVADRRLEARRRARFGSGSTALPRGLRGQAPALVLLPFAPRLGWGGVPASTVHRLLALGDEAPLAFAYPYGASLRVEVQAEGRRAALATPLAAGGTPDAEAWRAAIARALDAVGTRLLHVESLHGLPARALLALAASGVEIVLSAHDFALFCPRVNLLERPSGGFCAYCTDLDRCRRCRSHEPRPEAPEQAEYRAEAAELARAAAAIVYPSRFMAARHREWFGDLAPAAQHVVPPALPGAAEATPSREPIWPPRTIAFAGDARPHKGVDVFAAIVDRVRARTDRATSWRCFGGGEGAQLAALRRRGVLCTGYYRVGSLTRRLAAHAVDLVVLPSRFPESYCLVLDEAAAAGAVALVHDLGALGERTREQDLGWAVAGEPLAETMADAILEIVRGRLARPAAPRPERPTNAEIAARHLEIYTRVAGGSTTP